MAQGEQFTIVVTESEDAADAHDAPKPFLATVTIQMGPTTLTPCAFQVSDQTELEQLLSANNIQGGTIDPSRLSDESRTKFGA